MRKWPVEEGLWPSPAFLSQRFQKSIRPLNSWRVNNLNSNNRVEEQMEPGRVETPFTVTLTDMDFTAMNWENATQASQHKGQWWTNYVVKRQNNVLLFVFMLFVPASFWSSIWTDGLSCGTVWIIALFILLCMLELYIFKPFFTLCRMYCDSCKVWIIIWM